MNNRSKFKVIPGLSIRGPEVRKRVKNRTLLFDIGNGIYGEEEQLDNLRRMSRIDMAREALKNNDLINNLKSNLNERADAAARAAKESNTQGREIKPDMGTDGTSA